ncbi:MAG: hypothetical protein J6Z31_02080 [Fibrobacter sp.]|nr:hypothetical protein [Fibrobacter sp.]
MKKILLLCILLCSISFARFDCCKRKHATIKKEETSISLTVGVFRAEDEAFLQKIAASLSKEGVQVQIKKLDSQKIAEEALSEGYVDGVYVDGLKSRSDCEKKDALSILKKKIESASH